MTILIVDDDAAIREMLSQTLEDEGYVVTTAPDGQAALGVLDKGQAQIGLIILDLMMPRMNGWQFLEARQSTQVGGKIPVLVLSARNDLDQQIAALPVAGHLPKPCDLDQLLAKVALHYQAET